MVTLATSFLPELTVDKRRMKAQEANWLEHLDVHAQPRSFEGFCRFCPPLQKKNAIVILFVSDTPIMLKYFFIRCENFSHVI